MNRTVSLALTFLLAGMVGCGSNTATVSGIVTLDGKELDAGSVVFFSTGDGVAPAGSIGTDGKYTLRVGNSKSDDIPPGEYVATVVAVAKESPIAGQAPPSIVPAKYMNPKDSDLKFTVKPGANKFDLILKK